MYRPELHAFFQSAILPLHTAHTSGVHPGWIRLSPLCFPESSAAIAYPASFCSCFGLSKRPMSPTSAMNPLTVTSPSLESPSASTYGYLSVFPLSSGEVLPALTYIHPHAHPASSVQALLLPVLPLLLRCAPLRDTVVFCPLHSAPLSFKCPSISRLHLPLQVSGYPPAVHPSAPSSADRLIVPINVFIFGSRC